MLTKVVKYELRASGRYLRPALLAVLGVLVILFMGRLGSQVLITNGGNASVPGEILSVLVQLAGNIILSCLNFLIMGVLAVRFYKAFCGNEAYLTFSLPVKPSTHFVGHLLVTLVYAVFGVLLTLAALYVSLPAEAWAQLSGQNPLILEAGSESIPFTIAVIPSHTQALYIIAFLAILLLSYLAGMLLIYASIGIGGQFSSGRVGISVGAYFVLNTAEGILTLLLSLIPVGIYISSHGGETAMYNALMALPFAAQMEMILSWVLGFLVIIFLVSALFAVFHFFLCRYLYTKKLNLV